MFFHFSLFHSCIVAKKAAILIILNENGTHYKYLKIFYFDIFYNKIDGINHLAIKSFIKELFDIEGTYSKADLQILTEIYKLLDNNLVIK